MIALKRLDLDPHSIDAVLVSHLHGDHFGGLPFLVLDQQFARRVRVLHVAGPTGLSDRLHEAMEVLFPGSSTVERRFVVKVHELREQEASRVGPAQVSTVQVVHPSGAPALGLRVNCGGRIIAYSGDTEWSESLVDLSRDADLFICEAYTVARSIKYHMSYAALQKRRAQLGCRRLVLTHVGPDLLAHSPEIEAEIATDGYSIDLI